jgi:hypothetical protein
MHFASHYNDQSRSAANAIFTEVNDQLPKALVLALAVVETRKKDIPKGAVEASVQLMQVRTPSLLWPMRCVPVTSHRLAFAVMVDAMTLV